ncbi:hypothetical protein LAZ67_16000042 [Cordylochernes scorpioides]|uniref:Alpha-carbonic anhydrase domain-containing protein n=1 Tax=Cordylochernes scorpioides TaxID=51811 RepID=A0ABY6LEG7_9ARAC|nr:hypothetical protein LAZ67_16000042 [Cordylochernes scorpioides]
MILANRRITVREVAEDLNISIGSCHSIFINVLGMRRVAAKFVPKLLNCDQKLHRMNIGNELLDSVRDDPNLLQRVITGDEAWVYGYDVETKAQSSQWKLPHEPRPKKARQVRSNVKVLLTVFFDCRGVVHYEFLPQGRTVNKEYYLQVMRNLREAIRQKRPDLWKNKNWLLHHDNAPAHTSLLVRDFLAKNNTLMMPQPPYSPDLAPYGIEGGAKKIFKNDVLKCFEDWKNRWHKCIISHGDYFKGGKIGPDCWADKFPAAKGKRQSPVDICTADVEIASPSTRLRVALPARLPSPQLSNTGHGWQVAPASPLDGSKATVPTVASIVKYPDHLLMTSMWLLYHAGTLPARGEGNLGFEMTHFLPVWAGGVVSGGFLDHRYRFQQFHMHWGDCLASGSEHTVDGAAYPGELHFVHWNEEKYNSFQEAAAEPDGLVVLGVFLQKKLREYRRITYQQLGKSVGIGTAAINTIINDHLKYRKLVSRWVPHSLTEDQKLGRVTKLGFTILIQKQNGNLLFGALQNHLLLRKFAELKVGFIDIVNLEDGKTVNSDWRTTKFLPAVFEKVKQSRPRAQLREVLLHHDNARPHTSAQTLDFLANSGVQLVTHPPYSPDLAPCDFFYIQKLIYC